MLKIKIFYLGTSCRAVGQLYTYNSIDLSEKLGIDQNIFVLELSRKELKEKDKKNKVEKSKVKKI